MACDSVKSSTLAALHLLKNGCRSVKLIGIDGPDKSTWNIKVEFSAVNSRRGLLDFG